MIKNKRCTKFELDENTGRCKFYGGSLKHLAACYDDCKKRKKAKKNKIQSKIDECYIGVIVE